MLKYMRLLLSNISALFCFSRKLKRVGQTYMVKYVFMKYSYLYIVLMFFILLNEKKYLYTSKDCLGMDSGKKIGN